MFQTTGYTALINIPAEIIAVIRRSAVTKVSAAKASYPVGEVHPVFFYVLVL
jgi:hypothetical protein